MHFVGRLLTSFHLNSTSPGDGMTWSIGVNRRHSRIMSMSQLLSMAFFMAALTVCMHRSAMLFSWVYLREEVMCSKSHALANSLKHWELKCDLLLQISLSGTPCSAKICLVRLMISWLENSFSLWMKVMRLMRCLLRYRDRLDEGLYWVIKHNEEVIMLVKVENISNHGLPGSYWDLMWGTQQFGTSGVLDM